MRATTKRKPLLDLESELQGGHDDAGSRPKARRASDEDTAHRSRDGQSKGSSAAPQRDNPQPQKKEKEFAWMDSDAEGSASGSEGKAAVDDPVGLFEESRSNHESSRKSSKKNKSRSPSARSRSSSEGPPLPASVSEVQTFSQMVRMAEVLKKRVRSMATTELVQCLDAAARVKFFDGSFLQDMLIPQIQRQLNISRKKSPFTTEEIVTILCSLADLNCFDKAVFASSVRELADRRYMELQITDRRRLLVAFKAVKYECDDARQFFDWLCASVKAERYELLSAEQRMIVGNSKQGMHAPEGYLRSFMIGTTGSSGGQTMVSRPHGLSS